MPSRSGRRGWTTTEEAPRVEAKFGRAPGADAPRGVDAVRSYLERLGTGLRIIEFEQSTHTSELAARALGVPVGQIAKTVLFVGKGRVGGAARTRGLEGAAALVVLAGDTRVDQGKLKRILGEKVRLASEEECLAITGFAPGGLCPFGVPPSTRVLVDESLYRFDVVYVAAGSANSAVPLSPARLVEVTGGETCDVSVSGPGPRQAEVVPRHAVLQVDNHVHGAFTEHACGRFTLADVVKAGRRLGLRASLREHAPYPEEFVRGDRRWAFDWGWGIPVEELVVSADDLGRLFDQVEDSGISLGFEVDILCGFWDETARLVEDLARRARDRGLTVDAFNASHHLHRGRVWDTSREVLDRIVAEIGARTFIRDYFEDIRRAVQLGVFQGVSHLEAILKFDRPGPCGLFSGWEEFYHEQVIATLDAMKKADVALEYNTSGCAQPLGRPYLSLDYLHYAVEHGIPVVVGSDSHDPGRVGSGFDAAVGALLSGGAGEVCTFVGQRRRSIGLVGG